MVSLIPQKKGPKAGDGRRQASLLRDGSEAVNATFGAASRAAAVSACPGLGPEPLCHGAHGAPCVHGAGSAGRVPRPGPQAASWGPEPGGGFLKLPSSLGGGDQATEQLNWSVPHLTRQLRHLIARVLMCAVPALTSGGATCRHSPARSQARSGTRPDACDLGRGR